MVDPDPLLYLYDYPDVREREIAGLIAACLAYGQVRQIMKAVKSILEKMGPSPRDYVLQRSDREMAADFKGFVYRFARASHVVALFRGVRQVLKRFSSLEDCFCRGLQTDRDTVISGLVFLCRRLDPDKTTGHLLADPSKSSACKRSHLYLRWMVRSDAVDPGGWDQVSPSLLVIPVDRHMHRAGHLLGFTRRKAADLKTALEITAGFRRLVPDDPVKYDFCLTRYGIRDELNLEQLRETVAI